MKQHGEPGRLHHPGVTFPGTDSISGIRKGGCAMRGAQYLMVDDSSYDVEIAFFDFSEHGMEFDFQVASNGAAALDYLLAEDGNLRVDPPRAIFLDLHMPKVDGLEFLRRIKANDRTKGIPVVVLKSSLSPIELDECQRLGVHDFIGKPLEYENFISAIRGIDKNN